MYSLDFCEMMCYINMIAPLGSSEVYFKFKTLLKNLNQKKIISVKKYDYVF